MPAPRRAILADIHNQNLDPKKSYSKLNKNGKFFEEVTLKNDEDNKENKLPIFASSNVESSSLKQEEVQVFEQAKEETFDSKKIDQDEPQVESFAEKIEDKKEKVEVNQLFLKKKQKKKESLNQD
jgi:hypothetical protein